MKLAKIKTYSSKITIIILNQKFSPLNPVWLGKKRCDPPAETKINPINFLPEVVTDPNFSSLYSQANNLCATVTPSEKGKILPLIPPTPAPEANVFFSFSPRKPRLRQKQIDLCS